MSAALTPSMRDALRRAHECGGRLVVAYRRGGLRTHTEAALERRGLAEGGRLTPFGERIAALLKDHARRRQSLDPISVRPTLDDEHESAFSAETMEAEYARRLGR